jgi:LacI family transcriptional regulator
MEKKTAILCTSDTYALDVGQFLMRKNLRIPDDVGIMDVDNIDLLKYVSPRLTTIGYPIDLMGEKACEIIIKQIRGEKYPRSTLLKSNPIEGRSL